MLRTNKGEEYKFDLLFYIALAIVLVSLAFSIRFLNSISIAILPFVVLVHPGRRQLVLAAFRNPVLLAFLALYLIQLAGWFYTKNSHQQWREMGTRAGMLAYPFFFCAVSAIPGKIYRKLMLLFSCSLAMVSLICLGHASLLYSRHSDPSVFFYHDLVSLFHHHAVFFSFFLFYCIIYWLETGLKQTTLAPQKKWLIALNLFFVVMILLLSSKLVLVLMLIYLVFFAGRYFFKGQKRWILPAIITFLVLLISLISFTDNPVKKRFADIANGNRELFRQGKFSPDIYFNGVQFRLLTWRFTGEILNQQNAWLLGVSAGSAQDELNRRYTETNMYLGDGSGSRGFWNFDCHDVYLQTILESGITGLLVLLLACGLVLWKAIQKRNTQALIFFLSLLVFGFSESVLSTQYALQLFMFFPLLAVSVRYDR
jgi:O-antigen ligase